MDGLKSNGMIGVTPLLKLRDTRKVDLVTGSPLTDRTRLDRNANVDMMRKIIKSAKANGVDPYTALALAHQETGLSAEGDNEGNPFHLLDNSSDDLVDSGIKFLKDKMQYAKKLGKKNEADVIQAFNGYGRLGANTEGKHKSFYGIDVTRTPIDMNTNPVYGKRVIDIRDNILKNNPDVVRLVNEEMNNTTSAPKMTGAGLFGTQLIGLK